jgi:hypothetical protein
MTDTVPINNLKPIGAQRWWASSHGHQPARTAGLIDNQSRGDWAALRTWEDDGGRVPRIGRAVRGNTTPTLADDLARSFAPLGVRSEKPSAVRRCA